MAAEVSNLSVAVEDTAPRITTNGTNLPDAWLNALRAVRINLGLCVAGRAVLRFNDGGYQLSGQNAFTLGTKVKISSGDAALFSGLVTGASLEQVSGSHPELVVTVDDASCKLGLGSKAKTYLNMSYNDLLSPISSPAGMSPSGTFGTPGSAVHEYLLQSGSDLAFLNTIAERCGGVWWVEDTTLHVAPAGQSGAAITLTLAQDLIDFSVRASGLRPTKVKVRGWDATAQQDVVGDGTTVSNETADSAFVGDYVGAKLKGKLLSGDALQAAGDGNPNDQSEATAIANALLSTWQGDSVVARGTSFVHSGIKLLTKLTIANAGPASGSYTVSEVEHIFRTDGFYTRFTAGPSRPAGLVDTLGRAAPDAGFAIPGLLTATVSNNKDADHPGQVKIKYAGSGDIESAWARVVSLGGGSSRGAVFHPEVGDEVLVGFERGDSRHPVVIGGLNSNKLALAADDKLVDGTGKVEYRRITSRLAHVVELADGTGPDTQHILLKLGNAEHKLRLGADKCDLEMASGKPITIKAGTTQFQIDAQGNVTIAGNKITIDAKQDLVLQGLNVSMKAQANAAIEAQAQLGVKGALGSIEASGPLTVKGATVAIN